ncbi:MAG: hypothetical protein ACPHGV_08775 [Synechococcus sp.]
MPAGQCRRGWIRALALALSSALLVIALQWPAIATLQRPQPAQLPSSVEISQGPASEQLKLGGYLTNLSDLDLLENRFSAELLLWSLWTGPPEANPSDDLVVLNGIYDGDLQRFERVGRQSVAEGEWSLYRVRSQIVQRWELSRYPFDAQVLRLEVGLNNPLKPVGLGVGNDAAFPNNPGLILPGWQLHESSAFVSERTLMSDLGMAKAPGLSLHRQPTVVFQIPIERLSLLAFVPDFLGYILAVGLCCLSLLITRSRDDLILAAVVSAGGNYVFIASKLPVTAMSGFIGNLQLIVFLGVLYVVGADELIDNHLCNYTPRVSNLLRLGLLPSYLAFTLFGIYLIIP